MTKPSRPTQPRRWSSLAFGAGVTLAAMPALADLHRAPPVTLASPDARPWLAQAQGGEGGEAGVTASAPPIAAYLATLSIVEGHMLAARDLYVLGHPDLAVELSGHPQSEGTLDALRKDIATRKLPDPAADITSFIATLKAGAAPAEVDAALAAVSQVLNADAASETSQTRARFDGVVLLLKAAANEYSAALNDGTVADPMGWHEALSFVALARLRLTDLAAVPLSAKAAPKALAALTEADAAFGDPKAATLLAGDPQILLGVAARAELIASSVR